MNTLSASQLLLLSTRLLEGAGVPLAEAQIVAEELVGANMVGHDSHGVMRLMQYCKMIDDGVIRPGAKVEVLKEEAAYLLVDGNFNFGQVIASEALRLLMEKGRQAGTATAMIRNSNHVGRLGSYTDRAANEGFAALMAVNAPGPGGVAPFGGIDRKLGTNPISMAAPRSGGNFVLDMTSSATAEGKLRVAFQKGEQVPPGMMIDGHGNPSTNPGDYYHEPLGAILPLGGPLLGHKGSGLSVMIDTLCGIVSGNGVCRSDLPPGCNGVWMYVIDIERFTPREQFDAMIETYAQHIKSSRTMAGFDEILLPGEIELRRRRQREVEGVPIPDETWRQINELAARLGVNLAVL
ncbi:MAG: Ldh family oxidoreductase [Planctomycetaceae bacterium]|nr:Ldh family oxidoreductase [Planctomycetaceae bacterium]